MSLRELNHSRTREALVDAAIALFAEQSFPGETVDDVCKHAQVGRRTYFRYFPTKEAVAVAPLEDLWNALIRDVANATLDGTLIERLTATLIDTLGTLPATWPNRAVTSLALVASRPEVEATARALCRRTTAQALSAFDADVHDPVVSLAGDLFSAGVINAQQRWVGGRRKPTTAALQRLVAGVPALLSEALVGHV